MDVCVSANAQKLPGLVNNQRQQSAAPGNAPCVGESRSRGQAVRASESWRVDDLRAWVGESFKRRGGMTIVYMYDIARMHHSFIRSILRVSFKHSG